MELILFIFAFLGLVFFSVFKFFENQLEKRFLFAKKIDKSDFFIKKVFLKIDFLFKLFLFNLKKIPFFIKFFRSIFIQFLVKLKNWFVLKTNKVIFKLNSSSYLKKEKGSVSVFLQSISKERENNFHE